MKKSTKKYWYEGKDHIRAKGVIRQVARKYGAGCVEEERYTVDLHEVEPELYPKRSIRGYQADVLVTKRRGKEIHRVIAEVDGEYHSERAAEDELRDRAIKMKYGLDVVRFKKDKLLKGEYSESEIAEKLGLC